jgi:uncharacterized protein
METQGLVRADWEIRPRSGGPPIRGDLRAPRGPSPRTAVVICHGFKGFRKWAFFPFLARTLASRGHAVISFDFTRNGLGDDGVDFSALDRFAENTHSRNLDEIQRVLEAARTGGLFPRAPDRIAILGHSRGGAEALLAAVEEEGVDALVTWSAIASIPGRWSAEQVAAWERGERVEIPNARTGQAMPIDPAYWEDVVASAARLDVTAAAARLDRPWLIVHGGQDETVAVDDAHTLFQAAGPRAELCIVDGGTHTFGAAHPFPGPTPELWTATDITADWLDTHLAR